MSNLLKVVFLAFIAGPGVLVAQNQPPAAQGPLSAKSTDGKTAMEVWVGQEAESLIFLVDVTDDVHEQPFKGGDSLKGDAVLLTIKDAEAADFYSIYIARWPNKNTYPHVEHRPKGAANPWSAMQKEQASFPREGGMIYRIKVPLQALGFSRSVLTNGVEFNVVVTDFDGEGEPPFLSLVEGATPEGRKAPPSYVRAVPSSSAYALKGGRKPGINLDVKTSFDFRVLIPDNKDSLRLVLSNEGFADRAVKVDAVLRNLFGEEQKLPAHTATLAVGASEEWKIAAPDELGVFYVDYKLSDPKTGVPLGAGTTTFAQIVPAGPNPTPDPEFYYGIGGTYACALAGTDISRVGLNWGRNISREPGVWTFDKLDNEVKEEAKFGVQIQALVAYCPWWAAPEPYRSESKGQARWGPWSKKAPDPKAWRELCRRLAERYQGKIRYWEIWNEPDLSGFFSGTTDEYLNMLKIAHEEFKKVDPDYMVTTGGFATLLDHGGHSLNPDMQERVMQEAQDYFDVYAYHQHGGFNTYVESIDNRLIPLLKKYQKGDRMKPFLINEAGAKSENGERYQADTLVKKIGFTKARGGIGYLWYSTKDYRGATYGLFTASMHPKPSYAAAAALVHMLRNRSFQEQIDLGADHYVFTFADQKKEVLLGWKEGDWGSQLVVELAGSGHGVDLMGNQHDLNLVSQQAVLDLDVHPHYLLAEKPTPDAPAIRPVTSFKTREHFAIRGRPLTVEVPVHNFSGETLELEVDWDSPWKMTETAKKTWGLSPGETKSVTTTVQTPDDFATGSVQSISFSYTLPTGLQGKIDVPLISAAITDASGTKAVQPLFVLKDADQRVGYFEHDPSSAHLVWKGEQDLSAEVRMGLKEIEGVEALHLNVQVTDDRHEQRFKGGDIWKADSLQILLGIPDMAGFFEVGIYENNGKGTVHVFRNIKGLKNPWRDIKADLTQTEGGMEYDVYFPLEKMGLSREKLRRGIKFNLAVNDSDEGKRESAMQLAPGILKAKRIDDSPNVVFDISE
ncbi:MAG: hypothetical protein AAGK14_04785 [Verrucomicrobiota bacterium]